MAPLGVLYLKSWIDLCRVKDIQLGFIDEKRLAQGKGAPAWMPTDLDIIFYWIRPTTVRRSIECATRARASGKKLIAVGPGAYGWTSRYTDQGPFDLIVDGGPYGVVERVLRGHVITGTVTGSRFMPPVRLPEAAARYPIGRVTTTWGAAAGGTTFCVLPKMQHFDFRDTARIRAEIEMLLESKDVQYIEVADEALLMHPGTKDIIDTFADRKHWAATLNCERKYGKMTRIADAVDRGLALIRIDALSRTNEVLRSISRRTTCHSIEQTFKCALAMRKDGAEIIVRLLYGLPHQTWTSVLEDIDYFERRSGVYVELDPLIVQPGTWLWHHKEMSGLTLDDDNEVKSTRWMTEEEIKNLRIIAATRNQKLNAVGPRALMPVC